MKKTAERIGINTPEVYVYNDPVMSAFTYGETAPFVCIASSCVEKLNDEELICLMAHECGHIICKHTLYNSVVNLIQEFGERMGIITRAMSQLIYLSNLTQFSLSFVERLFRLQQLRNTYLLRIRFVATNIEVQDICSNILINKRK